MWANTCLTDRSFVTLQDVTGGIVVLLDNRSGEPEKLIATTTATAPASTAAGDSKMEVEEDEAPMPEPFTYPFDQQ